MSLNYIVLTGQLAQDSELRYTVSGQPVLQFSLTVKSTANSEEYSYIRVVSRKEYPADIVKQLKKGTFVLVEGQLLTRTYTVSSGFQKKNIEISLESFNILKHTLEESKDIN